MRTIVKIVVPTDFSDCSLQAVDEAVQFARRFGAKLHLLHVVQELTGRALSSEVGMARETLRQTLYNDAHANFATLIPRLRGLDHETAIRTGRASSAIVDYAREVDADLIVIATHGRRGLARLFIGSTTEEVVRKAACPVLTVRPLGAPTTRELSACPVHEEACDCVRETTDFRALLAQRGHVRVRDAMRRDLVKVGPETRLHEVVDLMIHYDISGVPVVDHDDTLLGYIPESYLLFRSLAEMAARKGEDGNTIDEFLKHQRQLYGKTASEIMKPAAEVLTVADSAVLSEAVKTMLDHHISRMPVVRDNKVVGYLTRADVLRVVRSLEEHHDTNLSDAEVARLVRAALDRSPDVAITGVHIEVNHGAVSIGGSVSTAEEVEHATSIVHRIPGVKSISNCLLVEQLLN